MLIPKPIIVNAQNKKKRAAKEKELLNQENAYDQPLLSDNEINTSKDNLNNEERVQRQKKQPKKQEAEDDHSNEPFGELMIHQLIETIEFVLGSISNTASYLRLWALSLAHSQLSSTFLSMTLQSFISSPSMLYVSIPGAILGSGAFIGISFAILFMMDSMECFLHTLRLHWVEFNNKFFKGNGKKYEAMSYDDFGDVNTS